MNLWNSIAQVMYSWLYIYTSTYFSMYMYIFFTTDRLVTSVSLRVLLRLLSEGVEVGVAVEEESWELGADPEALDAEK